MKKSKEAIAPQCMRKLKKLAEETKDKNLKRLVKELEDGKDDT